MSSCLIITQGEKMYIGADTACSVKTKDGYKRVSNNMPKLFTLGNSIFFCSGKKTDAEKCVNWIYDNFKEQIDVSKLEYYLKDNFTKLNEDNVFNIEFLLCNYNNHRVIQLSQYNNFKPIIYDYSEELRILCGGYKTKDSFLMTKKNIALKESVYSIYKNVFEDIADECVGGNVVICSSPTSYEICEIEENNIKYANEDDLFLLTSDFVTSGVVNGSQIIGGDIYSTNYSSTTGTHMNLLDGSFNFGHKIIYDAPTNKMTMKGVDIEWSTSTAPAILDIKGLSNSLSSLNTAVSNAQTTANSAKSVADNAKTIGDNLVNVLGYDGTKITGTYIYSPVISGGSILVGNKNGTYAEITPEGVLNCNGANVTGVIKATSGSIDSISATNLTITSGKITLGNTMLSSAGTSTIGGWIIGSKAIYNGTNSLTSTTSGTYLGTDGIRQYASSSAYIHMQNGVLTANGANVSGKLTAGSGSVLGADSYIGSSGSGWKITNNQIHTVKTTTVNVNGTNVTQPLLTLSAGSDASGTYLYAPNYFQIGGALDGVGNIGANFVGKVFIGGDCKITGNCNIEGAATATNLNITGGFVGDWFVTNGYLDGGLSSDLRRFSLHAKGISDTTNKIFYITISKLVGGVEKYEAGLTKDGWEIFTN